MTFFGQIVVGPPASGKSTYCNGIHQFLNGVERKTIIVNLDPANDFVPYDCAINIMDLVNLGTVMEETGLGPNGGMIYCMETLLENVDWLIEQLRKYEDCFVLFDCPGQAELFTNYTFLVDIIKKLQSELDFRLCCVNLVDAHYCTDPSKFVSVLLLSLKTMLHLELPHVNVLSKIDNVEAYGKLEFGLEYYTEVLNLSYLLESLPMAKKFGKLNEALCDLIETFGLVTFRTLNIQEKESVYNIIKETDRVMGISN